MLLHIFEPYHAKNTNHLSHVTCHSPVTWLSHSQLLGDMKRIALQVAWLQEEAEVVPAPNTKLTITCSIFELEAKKIACK